MNVLSPVLIRRICPFVTQHILLEHTTILPPLSQSVINDDLSCLPHNSLTHSLINVGELPAVNLWQRKIYCLKRKVVKINLKKFNKAVLVKK